MLLGEIPGLALDRTGVALLGAIALLVAKVVSPESAWSAIDVPTMALLFGLMIVSAQLRLGGFYGHLTRRITDAALSPGQLLAVLVGVAGGLSAVLANDIVCLASNVPAVMLLLPTARTPLAGPIRALASTLAGNRLLGSIANLIVVDQAARLQVAIGWRDHDCVGLPVTLLTLALAALWLWLRA